MKHWNQYPSAVDHLCVLQLTIQLINGFSFGRPVWYISMDASIPLAAAIEHNTFAPLMQKLVLGRDDSFSSPVERIFIATNGPEEPCPAARENNRCKTAQPVQLSDRYDRDTQNHHACRDNYFCGEMGS